MIAAVTLGGRTGGLDRVPVDPAASGAARASLAEAVEPMPDGSLRLWSRRLQVEEGAWDGETQVWLNRGWLGQAMESDPDWSDEATGSEAGLLRIEVMPPRFEPRRYGPADPSRPLDRDWLLSLPPGGAVAGHASWVDAQDPLRFLLVPEAADTTYRASCHWRPDDEGPVIFEWGRCFVYVAYPDEPRIWVEWHYQFDRPEDIDGRMLATVSREALGIARCYDVTEGQGEDPEGCVAAVLASSGPPAAPPGPRAAP